jgi:hypothetical protein
MESLVPVTGADGHLGVFSFALSDPRSPPDDPTDATRKLDVDTMHPDAGMLWWLGLSRTASPKAVRTR